MIGLIATAAAAVALVAIGGVYVGLHWFCDVDGWCGRRGCWAVPVADRPAWLDPDDLHDRIHPTAWLDRPGDLTVAADDPRVQSWDLAWRYGMTDDGGDA